MKKLLLMLLATFALASILSAKDLTEAQIEWKIKSAMRNFVKNGDKTDHLPGPLSREFNRLLKVNKKHLDNLSKDECRTLARNVKEDMRKRFKSVIDVTNLSNGYKSYKDRYKEEVSKNGRLDMEIYQLKEKFRIRKIVLDDIKELDKSIIHNLEISNDNLKEELDGLKIDYANSERAYNRKVEELNTIIEYLKINKGVLDKEGFKGFRYAKNEAARLLKEQQQRDIAKQQYSKYDSLATDIDKENCPVGQILDFNNPLEAIAAVAGVAGQRVYGNDRKGKALRTNLLNVAINRGLSLYCKVVE